MFSALLFNELVTASNLKEFDDNAKWLYNCPTTGYYAECTDEERTVYDTILVNLMQGHYTITYYSDIGPNEMESLINYVIKDRRLTANVSLKGISTEAIEIPGIGYYYKITVDDGLLDNIDVNNYLCRLEIENVLAGVKPEWSAEEELKYFHDYVCNRTQYIKDTEHCYTITGVFVDGIGTCQAYSKAFNLLCEKAGYVAVEVSGYSKDQMHMWSKVCVDGEWYTFDLTWDDTVLRKLDCSDEEYSMVYFGLPGSVMDRTHEERKGYKEWLPRSTESKQLWENYKNNQLIWQHMSDNELVGWVSSRLATEYRKGKYHIEFMDFGENKLSKRLNKLMPWIVETMRVNGYNISKKYTTTYLTEVVVVEVEGI